MTITKENTVDTLDVNKCTKLTAAERYVVEAGAYVAYAPNGSTVEKGSKIVSFTVADAADLDGYAPNTVLTDFKPDETGLYVFRRTIDVSDTNDPTFRTENFTYDAYYYNKATDEFFKVKLTSVTPDDTADVADDGVNTDGQLTAASAVFYEEITEVVTPELAYDAANHRLVATVDGQDGPTDAELHAFGTAYDDAIHAYQLALARQTAAVAEDNTASQAEKNALTALNNAKAAQAQAQKAYDDKLAEYTSLKASYDAADEELNGTGGISDQLNDAKEALYGSKNFTPTNVPKTADDITAADLVDLDTGLYKAWMSAEVDKKASLDDQEAFRQELLTYYRTVTREAGEPVLPSVQDSATINEMVANLTYTELTAFTAECTLHNRYEYSAKAITAKKAYDNKVDEYNALQARYTELDNRINTENTGLEDKVEAAQTALYGNTTNTPDNLPTVANPLTQDSINDLDDGLFKNLQQAIFNTNEAQSTYDDAAGDGSDAAQNHEDANEEVAQAKAALDQAKKLYDDAIEAYKAAGDIIIYIKLANDVTTGGVADKWQLLPTELEDKVGNDGKTDTATFFYTGILMPSETTAMLIDNVQLAPSVTEKMFKSFDFDLNVALDSVQVAYKDDNKTLKTEPATELGAVVAFSNNQTTDAALTWSATTP